MTDKINLNELNTLSQDHFTQQLADIYEHSSWIPNQAWSKRPFTNIETLHNVMLEIVENSTENEKLKLLRAHPQLAGKEAKSGNLTKSSTEEQTSAKLDSLSRAEMNEITLLNQLYMETHQFPFIIAVKGHTKKSIFEEFRSRVNNPTKDELNEAISQVGLIANFRLNALMS